MKLKKITALLLAGLMTVSLAACGGNDDGGSSNTGSSDNTGSTNTGSNDTGNTDVDTPDDGGAATSELSGKLVVWTLAADLQKFADRFQDQNPGVEMEVVITEPANYPTTVQAALGAGQKTPDIIVGEPQMLGDFFDAGFFEDLDQAPYNIQSYADQVVDFMMDVGKDTDGVQRAISYQITPAGFFYRADIAEKVFGTSDPDEIGKYFASYDAILDAAHTLKDAGYRMFASTGETNYCSGNSAWVIDGKLNVDPSRVEYMDLCVTLWKDDLTAYAGTWTAPWNQAMSGPVPILSGETQGGVWEEDENGNPLLNVWDAENFNANAANFSTGEAEVFSYGLPAWGALTIRDAVAGTPTEGQWRICGGPAPGFGGGTWIGISQFSENKDLAWEFVKFCTLNEDTAEWWMEESKGDVVSYIAAMEKHADDENAAYGNQKTNALWLELAEDIDYSKVTQYDGAIGDAWGAAISALQQDLKTKEEAINDFFDSVAATYPMLEIDREGILASLGL